MPFARLTLAGVSLDAAAVSSLQAEITDLLETVLRKKPELSAVLIEQVPVSGWFIGRRPISIAAHLEVNVTAGTNSQEEKARFIEAAADLLRQVLGPLVDPATYVIVKELPADAWGYDGRTQEARRYRS